MQPFKFAFIVHLIADLFVLAVRNVACLSLHLSDEGSKGYLARTRPRNLLSQVACQGIKKIPLDIPLSHTMVSGNGAAGPAPDLRHQPPGFSLNHRVSAGFHFQ